EPVAPLEREPVRLLLRVDFEPEERAAGAAASAGDVVRAGALAPRGVCLDQAGEPGVRAGMMPAHRLDDHVDRLPDESPWDVDEGALEATDALAVLTHAFDGDAADLGRRRAKSFHPARFLTDPERRVRERMNEP